MPRPRRNKRKAKVKRMPRPPKREFRWYVSPSSTPFVLLTTRGMTRVWLEERRDGQRRYVDAAGRFAGYTETRPSGAIEVHAPGIHGDAIVSNKRLWVSQGL